MRPAPNRRHALLSMALATFTWTASAQAYPEKPITLIVPYPAGAAVDRVGRALSAELSKRLGVSVVVDNVGGASGTLGAKKLLRAPADGHTLMVGTVNDMLVAPVPLKAGYSVKDFTAIAKLSVNSTVLVAHPGFPANNMEELIAMGRRQSQPLLSGATGTAMMQTVGGTLVAEAGGFKVEHVIYKGGAPLLNDLLGGQVQVGTVALLSALPLIREGKLKALGVIATERDPAAPQIPATGEHKPLAGISAELWTGLFGPANLPAPVVARLAAVVRDILNDPTYRAAEFKAGSNVVAPMGPGDFTKLLQQDAARMQPVLSKIQSE